MTTPGTCISDTSSNQLRVVLEPEIQACRCKERQWGVVDTQVAGSMSMIWTWYISGVTGVLATELFDASNPPAVDPCIQWYQSASTISRATIDQAKSWYSCPGTYQQAKRDSRFKNTPASSQYTRRCVVPNSARVNFTNTRSPAMNGYIQVSYCKQSYFGNLHIKCIISCCLWTILSTLSVIPWLMLDPQVPHS